MKKLARRGRYDPSSIEISSVKNRWLKSELPIRLTDALFTLLKKNVPSLFERVLHWLKTLVAEYQKMVSLKGERGARKVLEQALANPVLLDRRKSKKLRDHRPLVAEYNLILHKIRSLPGKSNRPRIDLIRDALRREFPEVKSSDFASAPSASETAYWILARRHTNDNVDSLITRLNRARRQMKGEIERGYSYLGLKRRRHGTPRTEEMLALAIEYLTRALPKVTKEKRNRIKKAIGILEAEIYEKKLEKL